MSDETRWIQYPWTFAGCHKSETTGMWEPPGGVAVRSSIHDLGQQCERLAELLEEAIAIRPGTTDEWKFKQRACAVLDECRAKKSMIYNHDGQFKLEPHEVEATLNDILSRLEKAGL
jgi:hypothetical protein